MPRLREYRPPASVHAIHVHRPPVLLDEAPWVDHSAAFSLVAFTVVRAPTDLRELIRDTDLVAIHGIIALSDQRSLAEKYAAALLAGEGQSLCFDGVHVGEPDPPGIRSIRHNAFMRVTGLQVELTDGEGAPYEPIELRFRGWAERDDTGKLYWWGPGPTLPLPAQPLETQLAGF